MDPSLPKAPFPAPPPFWKHFTTDNLEKLKTIESTSPSDPSTKTLPLELTFLRPPPPPPSDAETYPAFSQPNFVNVTPVLPPPELLLFDASSPNLNHAALLTRLTKSLLLNFLELITILSEAPAEYSEKIEDIKSLMINIHAVINMYRPHQARENVKQMLEGMIEDGRKEIEECERVKGDINRFLKVVEGWKEKDASQDMGADTEMDLVGTNGNTGDSQAKRDLRNETIEERRRLWKLMDEIGND
jgi:mediator of RNA polymerase II transcription subunit 7